LLASGPGGDPCPLRALLGRSCSAGPSAGRFPFSARPPRARETVALADGVPRSAVLPAPVVCCLLGGCVLFPALSISSPLLFAPCFRPLSPTSAEVAPFGAAAAPGAFGVLACAPEVHPLLASGAGILSVPVSPGFPATEPCPARPWAAPKLSRRQAEMAVSPPSFSEHEGSLPFAPAECVPSGVAEGVVGSTPFTLRGVSFPSLFVPCLSPAPPEGAACPFAPAVGCSCAAAIAASDAAGAFPPVASAAVHPLLVSRAGCPSARVCPGFPAAKP
jgi:hypothetical protein